MVAMIEEAAKAS
uniref:Uncharacterized protein n=1 Tax=Arundo donax TaxID=35708 RepID=A0A0A8ZZT7_ARUDO